MPSNAAPNPAQRTPNIDTFSPQMLARITRHIALFLSLLILVGHDVIPHHHHDADGTGHHQEEEGSVGGSLSELFAQFGHSNASQQNVYVPTGVAIEISAGSTVALILPAICPPAVLQLSPPVLKRRLQDISFSPQPPCFQALLLRGPPSRCQASC